MIDTKLQLYKEFIAIHNIPENKKMLEECSNIIMENRIAKGYNATNVASRDLIMQFPVICSSHVNRDEYLSHLIGSEVVINDNTFTIYTAETVARNILYNGELITLVLKESK